MWNTLEVVASTPHMAMIFSVEDHSVIITVKVNPNEARTYHALSLKVAPYVPLTNLAGTNVSL